MPARLLAVLLAVLCAVLVSCGDDSGNASEATCQYPADGSDPAREVEPPPGEPTAEGDVDATISTSAGDVGATLDGGAAPCTIMYSWNGSSRRPCSTRVATGSSAIAPISAARWEIDLSAGGV